MRLHLPSFVRVIAIVLMVVSPFVAVAHFYPALDRLNKAAHHIPAFTLVALSAIIFYRIRWYIFLISEVEPWTIPDLQYLPRRAQILVVVALMLLLMGLLFFPEHFL
jgi:hypothetical protein